MCAAKKRQVSPAVTHSPMNENQEHSRTFSLTQVFVNNNRTNLQHVLARSAEEFPCFNQAYQQHFDLLDNQWQNGGTGQVRAVVMVKESARITIKKQCLGYRRILLNLVLQFVLERLFCTTQISFVIVFLLLLF